MSVSTLLSLFLVTVAGIQLGGLFNGSVFKWERAYTCGACIYPTLQVSRSNIYTSHESVCYNVCSRIFSCFFTLLMLTTYRKDIDKSETLLSTFLYLSQATKLHTHPPILDQPFLQLPRNAKIYPSTGSNLLSASYASVCKPCSICCHNEKESISIIRAGR